jgi:hypoxanthine phosphoribosyltransferase
MVDTKSKIFYSWEEVEELVDLLCKQILKSGVPFNSIFGMPRGGLIPAVMMSHKLNIPLIINEKSITESTLIVDDICDSGETFKELHIKYPLSDFACLHFKPHTSIFTPNYSANKFLSDDWIVYPWEEKDSKTIQDYLK